MVAEQFGIYWVELDPTRGGEMAKTRPCVVVSPEELNENLSTVIIAPVTSTIRNYPFRVRCFIANRAGEIAVDQIRTVAKERLRNKMGKLGDFEIKALQDVLYDMFCV